MQSETCLGCIPIRAGVLTLTIISILGHIAQLCYISARPEDENRNYNFGNILFLIAAIFGLAGVLKYKSSYVKVYAVSLAVNTAYLIAGIIIVMVYASRQSFDREHWRSVIIVVCVQGLFALLTGYYTNTVLTYARMLKSPVLPVYGESSKTVV